MDDKTLKASEEMEQMIRNDQSYSELYEHLKGLKAVGFSKEEAFEALEIIRAKYREEDNENKEDLVMELMDVASNFCSTHQKIWD